MSKQKRRNINAIPAPMRLPGLLPSPPAVIEPSEQVIPKKAGTP